LLRRCSQGAFDNQIRGSFGLQGVPFVDGKAVINRGKLLLRHNKAVSQLLQRAKRGSPDKNIEKEALP
jgi:hypothetical protein